MSYRSYGISMIYDCSDWFFQEIKYYKAERIRKEAEATAKRQQEEQKRIEMKIIVRE